MCQQTEKSEWYLFKMNLRTASDKIHHSCGKICEKNDCVFQRHGGKNTSQNHHRKILTQGCESVSTRKTNTKNIAV